MNKQTNQLINTVLMGLVYKYFKSIKSMLKNKKQRKSFEQPRLRSQSEDLYDNYDFEEEMKCNQTLQEINYFTSNLEDDKGACKCSKCQGFISTMENKDLDADLKKRLKRREYKKRQKLKAQQKKQQALKDLSVIIGDIYQMKTTYEGEREMIQQCLKAIQKNVNRFYEFINAVIRQQTIKKQMRICLMQLANSTPDFAKVPHLYEQFMKVRHASPQVQKIINQFIDIISQKTQQITKYQKDLDKKTFRFLLISDTQNRNAFLQVIKIIEEGNIKYERQKEMLRMIIEMIREKNISSECSSSQQGSQQDYSQNQEDIQYEQYGQVMAQNTTRASEQQEDYNNECFDEESNLDYDENQNEKENREKKGTKRRRKNKGLKQYEASFQKTYETLILLEKTLSIKKDDKIQCNVEDEWLQKIRERFLKKYEKPMNRNQQ